MRAFILLLIVSLVAAAAIASPRISANYSLSAETTDGGGRRVTSANYTCDGSVAVVASISSVANPVETLKHGYIGQLFDVSGLVLNSAQPNINEGGTLQLAAWQLLDDASFISVNESAVAWSVASGPLAGISASGLATAGLVFQNTAATVQGTYQGNTGLLNLTMLDTISNNFGSYAGDGIGDDWQVQYFGQNNPNAAPNVDASGNGQTNLFAFAAGLNPLDPNSRFVLNIASVTGQPTHKSITFSPRLSDRTYKVLFKTNLNAATWSPLSGATVSDNGQIRTVTDTSPSGGMKFYRIEITKP